MEEDIDDAATPAAAERGEGEEAEVTGEPRVDEALRSLGELGDLPVSEHPPVFERVHASLVDVLGELRSGVGTEAGRRADSEQADPRRIDSQD